MATSYPSEIVTGIIPDLKYWRDFAALVEKHAGAFKADLEQMIAREDEERSEGKGM